MNIESVFIGCRTREDTRTKGLRQASERVNPAGDGPDGSWSKNSRKVENINDRYVCVCVGLDIEKEDRTLLTRPL